MMVSLGSVALAGRPGDSQQDVSGAVSAVSDLQRQIEALQGRMEILDGLALERVYLSVPGVGYNTPTAWGGFPGEWTLGMGLVNKTRVSDSSDGIVGVAVGLGNPREGVGLDVAGYVLDLSSLERGSFSFKLHRALSGGWAVAAGIDNTLVWGGSDTDNSLFAVVSKTVELRPDRRDPFSRLYLSLGAGGGRFRSEANIDANRGTVGVFGGAATNLSEAAHLFLEWSATGKDINLGASFLVSPTLPLVITPAVADLTGNANNGTKLGVGISYQFGF